MAKLNCKDKCGNVTIPYPFGIGHGCYSRPEFSITCKESNDESEPTTPRLMETRMVVNNISLEVGELEIMQLVNRDCYDAQGNLIDDQSSGGLRVYPPYTVSGEKNWFVAVGCDTYARFIGSRGDQNYTTGCISVCHNNNISGNAIDKEDSCSGMGCCETKIPPLLNNLSLTVGSYRNHRRVWDFNPCGYAFVVRKGNFTFSNTSFQELRNTPRLPLVLDWQFGETDCQYARDNGTYACKGNSNCTEKSTGYICVCNPGFHGNPYLHDCQDINECDSDPTLCENGKCKNNYGNYTCECDSGYHNVDKIKCIKDPNAKRWKILLGVSLSFSVLVVAILWKYRKSRKKKEEDLRRKYFKENGGELLKEKLGNKARIFTEAEIQEATNNYAVRNELGRGRYGIVYRGVLDKQEVAIKKPHAPIDDQKQIATPIDDKKQIAAPIDDQKQIIAPIDDQKQITPNNQFADEMTVLYQINHNNVVRFVGCCLTTKTPILVYEFISKGSLYKSIHVKEGGKPLLSLEKRLKIAAKTAGALAYFHEDTSMPIIHGDVKTANILLDEDFTAKVSDFGASRLVPKDENQKSTLVQGTVGYVDPEYLQSNTLTEKSDVYSFGVVLAELLTGLKAEENLANDFVAWVEGGTLRQILDEKIVEGLDKEIVRKAANLAKRCLKSRGEERPSMREVAAELQLLVLTMPQHPSGGGEAKDTSAECLLEMANN
ncbi:hypothetical protein ACE6H2_013678 [Prunus campanulata]